MKIKDYLCAALWEVKAGKRKVFFISVFMFIGLMMLILTNVTEENILDYLDRGILETPALKTVIVHDENLFEQLKSDERVADTYIYAGIWSPNFENSKELIGVETNQIDVQSYSKVYEDYIIAGRGIENENEIIVPKYLIEYGNLSSSEYIDMEDCLGKKIVVSDCRFNIYTGEELGEVNYEFTVVGVIDNLALSVYGFFAEEESINDKKRELADKTYDEDKVIDKLYSMGLDETYLDKIDNIFYDNVIERKAVVCVSAKDRENIEKEFKNAVTRMAEIDENIKYEVSLISMCFRIFAIIILVVVFVNIIINIIHSISEKEWDLALKVAMGYDKKQLSTIVAVEYFLLSGASLLLSTGLSFLILKFIKKLMTGIHIMFISIPMEMKPGSCVAAATVCIMAVIISYVTCNLRIRKINIAKALKSEKD